VAVGGTSTNRNQFTGELIYEGAWNQGGGGQSQFEPRPPYQNGIDTIAGPWRSVPDISSDANPITGVWVLDSNDIGGPGGWLIVGGTSVSSPTLAGIVNSAGNFHKSSARELHEIYAGSGHGFNDIQTDNCGNYGGYFAVPGFDFCTGVGSPQGYYNK
jgi:subtilase family serine protease